VGGEKSLRENGPRISEENLHFAFLVDDEHPRKRGLKEKAIKKPETEKKKKELILTLESLNQERESNSDRIQHEKKVKT